MGKRPARIYREFQRPYTRTSKRRQKLNYIRGIPGLRIARFNVGNVHVNTEGAFALVTESNIQIRDTALESVRVAVTSYMKKNMDPKNYHIRLNVYPHHILREHAQAAVAQADRFYNGMKKPFGKVCGRAARVKSGTPIIIVRISDKTKSKIVKDAFKKANPKLGCATKVIEVEGKY
jgi:large subunit ribosomal protein L10e